MHRYSFPVFFAFVFTISRLFGQTSFVEDKSGIEIIFTAGDHIFPDYWYSGKINARAASLSPKEYERVKIILQKVMAKYPLHVFKENLKKIYALNNMNFYDLPYGGTYSMSKKAVYITDDTLLKSSDLFIEAFFHHEFSSILFRKHPFYLDRKAWKAINPSDFHYGQGGTEAIRNGSATLAFEPDLFETGFLNKYSQSSFEDDVNVFSQNIFNGGKQFWVIVDHNDKIRAKTTLIIWFYHQIDPVFTEEYFRKL